MRMSVPATLCYRSYSLLCLLQAMFFPEQNANRYSGVLDRRLTFSLPAAYSLRCAVAGGPLIGDHRRDGSLRYLFEDYAFDTDRRELHRGARCRLVAPQVFDLLDYLIRNRERVVSKDELINAIWNGRSVSDAALTTRLNAARGAIGDTARSSA